MAQALTSPDSTRSPVRTKAHPASDSGRLTRAPRLILLVVLLVAVWLALLPFTSVPEAVPASAAASQFSAERALADVAFIAAEPHPIGSDRQATVRDYLVSEIRALGLAPEIQQETMAGNAFNGIPTVISLENVMVGVPGSNSQGAILISGHYDSVPTGGGGADCAACTATVLETLRAVVAGPPLQNDVIFLFTDGEEVGVAGATAFAFGHPWMEDVALTLVHEGLGDRGAALLYANSAGSGPLLLEALAAAPSPRAYSLINELMWSVQGNSGSDLDAFIAPGGHGLAFVNISLEGSPSYHTSLDNAQTLDPGTLQHHGDYALALVRHFGNRGWDRPVAAEDRVTFPVAPGRHVSYPESLALPLALLGSLLFLGLVAWGWRRGLVRAKGFLGGALLFFLALVAGTLAATGLWWLVRWLNPALHSFFVGGWYDGTLYLLALIAVATAVTTVLLLPFTRKAGGAGTLVTESASLYAGILAWWAVFALLFARALPGLSYLFVWPLLAALLALGWQWAQPAGQKQVLPRLAALLLPALVALVLMVPALYVLAILGARLEAILGYPFYVLPLPFAILLFGLLLPQVAALLGERLRRLVPALLVVAAALLLVAAVRADFDPAHPGTNTVTYELDADAGTARWVTTNDSRSGRGTRAQLDEWTRQFFPDGGRETTFSPWLSGMMTAPQPALEADAAALALAPSAVRVVEQQVGEGVRQLTLEITPPAEATDGILSLVAEGGTLTAAELNGNALRLNDAHRLDVDVFGRPGAFTLALTATGGGPLQLTLKDRYFGLPQLSGQEIAKRPAWLMPAPYNRTADSQIVISRHSFE